MRRLILLPLVFLPTACNHVFMNDMGAAGYGRGLVNPPTIAEVIQSKCLAVMVYGESRGESEIGQVAVAFTAVNRATKKSVCNVVLAPKQYSIFNDNPALKAAAMSPHLEPRQKNIIDKAGWEKAVAVAKAVIRKEVDDPTNGATHYLSPVAMKALGYQYPAWSRLFKKVAMIDNHIFFKDNKLVDKQVASL